jgi:hypothetical protein
MWKAFRFILVPAAGVRLAAHLTSWIAGHAFDLTARPGGFWLWVAADILLLLSFSWLLLATAAAWIAIRWWKSGTAERRRALEKSVLLRRWAARYWNRFRTAGSGWGRPVAPERRVPVGT